MHPIPDEMFLPVIFKVEANTQSGEKVVICGGVEQLGNWQVKDSLELTYDEREGLWTATILLPIDRIITYRYLIVMNLRAPETHIVVRRWEAPIKPRYLDLKRFNGGFEVEKFGSYAGVELIEPGWLTTNSVVQFKIYNSPVTFWRKKPLEHSIKMITIDRAEYGEDDDVDDLKAQLADWPVVEIAVMNQTDSEFVPQKPFGHLYNPDEFVIFRVNVLQPETFGYNIQFFNVADNKLIGTGCIIPNNLGNTSGSLTLPILGVNHTTIGHIIVEYLLIKPLKSFSCDAKVSYAHAWHKNKGGVLDVGHRGSGNARRKDTIKNLLENTVASFNYAARHGADMVELDVQLSSDMIPVIYHDYNICISMKKKKKHQSDHELMELAVRHLTANQLQSLNLSPAKSDSHQHDFEDDDSEENQPFPTLRHVLESVDSEVGFNIEIKCPMQLRDGTWEAGGRIDLNDYIDIILKEILDFAASRTIILSCFHPDICSMVRLKQNKYPLLFLTQGITEKYPPYYDTRTASVPMAAYFAQCMSFLGINVHAEDLLRHNDYISFVKSCKLVLFCWGEDINHKDVLKNLKSQGVDGVIYDKIDEFALSNQVFTCNSTSDEISECSSNELTTSSDSANSSI